MAAIFAHLNRPRAVDGYYQTALHHAVVQAPERVPQLLAGGWDPNAQDRRGRTPLHLTSDLGTIQMLLAAGSNPNVKNWQGVSPLSLHAWRHDRAALTLLLDAGGDPDITDGDGWPLLGYVLRDERLCALLLQYGADPDRVFPDGSKFTDWPRERDGRVREEAISTSPGERISEQGGDGDGETG